MLAACIEHPTIQALILHGNLGKPHVIRDILDSNENMKELFIGYATLSRQSLESHAAGCRRNKTVKALSLYECTLDASGANILENIFLASNGLMKMCLAKVSGLDSTEVERMIQGICSNKSVQTLNFYNSNIITGALGGDSLKDLLRRNRSLTYLNVSHNALGTIGACRLAQGLRYNNVLSELRLGACDLMDKAATSIAKSLETNTSLTVLDVSWNSFGIRGLRALTSMLHQNQTLTMVDLEGNVSIGDAGVNILADLLVHNKILVRLDLETFGIGDEGASALFEALETNTTLRQLNLSYSDGYGVWGVNRCSEDEGYPSFAHPVALLSFKKH